MIEEMLVEVDDDGSERKLAHLLYDDLCKKKAVFVGGCNERDVARHAVHYLNPNTYDVISKTFARCPLDRGQVSYVTSWIKTQNLVAGDSIHMSLLEDVAWIKSSGMQTGWWDHYNHAMT